MTKRTDNLNVKNVTDYFIVIRLDINRPIRPGYLRATVRVGDIVSQTCIDDDGNKFVELYEVVRQHEDLREFRFNP